MKKIFTLAASISTMLLIISTSVVGILNFRPLYTFDIKYLQISETANMSAALLKENYNRLIDYNSMFNHNPLEFAVLKMSEGGRTHFEEVKNIFVGVQYILILTFITSLLLAWILIRKYKSFDFLKITSTIAVVIPAALGAFVAINWDKAFLLFHELMFDNDFWLFSPSEDPIIKALPDEFFFHCAALILILVLIFSFICNAVYRLAKKRSSKSYLSVDYNKLPARFPQKQK